MYEEKNTYNIIFIIRAGAIFASIFLEILQFFPNFLIFSKNYRPKAPKSAIFGPP